MPLTCSEDVDPLCLFGEKTDGGKDTNPVRGKMVAIIKGTKFKRFMVF